VCSITEKTPLLHEGGTESEIGAMIKNGSGDSVIFLASFSE